MRALMSKNVSSTCAVVQPALAQQLVVGAVEPPLPDRARRLQLLDRRAGAPAASSRRIPRAIAPEVTTTTSTPARVQRGDLLADARDARDEAQLAGVVRRRRRIRA